MTIAGRVASLPQRTTGLGGTEGWRFVLAADAASIVAGAPPRLLLSCYQMPATPRAGERWQLALKLRRPHGLLNPQGFDQALWMLEQDLPAAASCRGQGQQRLSSAAPGVDALRQSLRDAIDRELGQARDRRGAGVLAALSLGDQGAVSWTTTNELPAAQRRRLSYGKRPRRTYRSLRGWTLSCSLH